MHNFHSNRISSTFDSLFATGSSVHTRVLRGLKFCVRSRPALENLTPTPLHPQEFEKFCPLPPRTRTLLTRTRPADHPNPRSPRTFLVSNPHLPENY